LSENRDEAIWLEAESRLLAPPGASRSLPPSAPCGDGSIVNQAGAVGEGTSNIEHGF